MAEGFLGDLAPLMERTPYKGSDHFLDAWKREVNARTRGDCKSKSERMIFTAIDEQTFTQDFLDPTSPCSEVFVSSFDSTNALVLIRRYNTNEPKVSLRHLKSSYFNGPSGGKQPEEAWSPKEAPPGYSCDWPSVILEVAYSDSENHSKLSSDVGFWLLDSNCGVKVVLTMMIDRIQSLITIEKWALQEGREHRSQSVSIRRSGNQNITVEGGPLVIEFEKLFLRSPDIPRETDVRIDAGKLELVATSVWDEQEF